MLHFLLAWSSAVAALALLVWCIGGAASAQSSEGAVTIQEIKPSFASSVVIGRGDEVFLSVIVIGSDGNEDQSLASEVDITWTASDGELEVHLDTTRATYSAPHSIGIGTHTVTASAGSACVGDATDCTATFTIKVWHVHRPPPPPPQNPPGEIPTALKDAEGNQYSVFTPEEGGTFNSGEFWVSASSGDVPNGEYIGVRMFENGPASNAGMSYHRYTLSGNQYRISVIDAERAPISSYSLNGTVTICISVPDELRTNIADLRIVTKNNDGTLTPMLSSVRITRLGLVICGYTNTLPVTVAVGVPGTPPEMLPATGGAAPTSRGIIAWALLVGVALIATGTFATVYRRRRHEGTR